MDNLTSKEKLVDRCEKYLSRFSRAGDLNPGEFDCCLLAMQTLSYLTEKSISDIHKEFDFPNEED